MARDKEDEMTIELDNDLRQELEAPNFWHFATVNPDGSPQSTTMWVHTRDGKILVNTALGRKKPRNIEHESRVALSFHRHDDGGYHSWAIQGRVVETVVGDQAEADIDMLAQKYLGQSPYPWRSPGEQRVTFLIEPVNVFRMG
jgi:PPOX class probable F420-dependent enzyme